MADIAPGYTFASGEKNINHTKLNLAASGNIQTSWHTSKGAVAANPDPTTTEVMVYIGTGFQKGTLSTLFLDHDKLLNTRTTKSVPLGADSFMISDSAAAGAYKKTTLDQLLYGPVAWSTPIGADSIPIKNSVGNAMGVITLNNLIHGATDWAAPIATDEIPVWDSTATSYKKLKLLNLLNGVAHRGATPYAAAGDKMILTNGTNIYGVTLAELISSLAALASPAGTELFQVYDGANLKGLTLANLRAYTVSGYVHLAEEQTAGTHAGTFTLGAWRTRSINQEKSDTSALATVAANQFTLLAGTYRARISAPGFYCGSHQIKLVNITDTADTLIGTPEYSGLSASDGTQSRSVLTGVFTIAATKTFEVQHRCTSTRATDGLGKAANLGLTEVFTTAEFFKLA